MGVYIWSRLPSEYQEVEYIQSSGSQHINTGYIPNYNTKIACKFNHDNNSTDQSIFGARGNNNANEYTLWSAPTVNTSTSVAIFNKTSGSNLTKYAYNTDIEFEYNKSGWKYGTQSGTWSPSSGTPNLDLFIFTINTNGTADSRKFKGKLYYFKIRDNGTLVRNFVPCYRKSDSVIGLYDLVNNQFYTNSGTGTFSKGNDVTMTELKNAYIGEVWTPTSNTLLYLPLKSDIVDKSGQATTRVFSSSGISYTTVGGVPSIHIGTTGGILLTTPNPLVTSNTANQTISVLVYVTSQSSSSSRKILEFAIQNKEHTMLHLSSNGYYGYYGESAGSVATPSGSIIANQRVHIVATTDASSKKIYINGSLSASGAGSNTPRGIRPNSTEQSQTIFNVRGGLTGSQGLNGNARELIMEDKVWTADQVSNYYNMIKQYLGF